MAEIVLKDESYRIMGACFEVYKEMGCGFLEDVYQECLELELATQAIPFRSQLPLNLRYKGQPLDQKYIPDFICFEAIIVEIKALKKLAAEHRAQVHNYSILAIIQRSNTNASSANPISFFRVVRVFRG
jgi:GxxExxY protein